MGEIWHYVNDHALFFFRTALLLQLGVATAESHVAIRSCEKFKIREYPRRNYGESNFAHFNGIILVHQPP